MYLLRADITFAGDNIYITTLGLNQGKYTGFAQSEVLFDDLLFC